MDVCGEGDVQKQEGRGGWSCLYQPGDDEGAVAKAVARGGKGPVQQRIVPPTHSNHSTRRYGSVALGSRATGIGEDRAGKETAKSCFRVV